MVMIPKKKDGPAAAATETKAAPTLPKATSAPAPIPTTAPSPKPENPGDPVPTPDSTSAPAPAAASTPNLPAAQGTRAVGAVASRMKDVVKETYKDAFTVDWNTLHRVMPNNGNFLDVEAGKAVIAPELIFELMSYQDNFQISPGTDDDDDIQYVRYSDDGITTTQGENIAEYIAAMKEAGYTECKMAARVVLAGTIVGGKMDGKLVQMNLSPSSKAQFDRFKMQAAIDVSRGKKTPEDLARMKLTCTVETKGKNSWTKVLFDYAPA